MGVKNKILGAVGKCKVWTGPTWGQVGSLGCLKGVHRGEGLSHGLESVGFGEDGCFVEEHAVREVVGD